MKEYLVHENKWTKISEKLKGRDVFSIKNRFTILQRHFCSINSKEETKICFLKYVSQRDKKLKPEISSSKKLISFQGSQGYFKGQNFPIRIQKNYISDFHNFGNCGNFFVLSILF